MVANIAGITFDLALSLIHPERSFPSYREISEMFTRGGYEIYPQELETANQKLITYFLHNYDLRIHQIIKLYNFSR